MTIELEGKWSNLRRMVENLIEQGWIQVSIEADADFKYTTVKLQKGE